MRVFHVFVLLLVLFPGTAYAGEADVIEVRAKLLDDHTYQFYVTVLHTDTGWKHYVNKWDVVAPDGRVLGTRTLYHPHVDEQPFTRSLSGVQMPEKVGSVIIRAHDSVHEYGGKAVIVDLPQ